MLKITFIPASGLFFSISGPLLVTKQNLYVPLGSQDSPSASCIPDLLSVGVWFMRIKPLQTADYQIKFSKCWQLKYCHMLMLLHHWKSELSIPRRHIRLLFVFCYPSGEQLINWTPSNRVQQAPGRGCASVSFCHCKGVLQTLFGYHCLIIKLHLNGKSELGPLSW